MEDRILKILQENNLFKQLSSEALSNIAPNCTLLKYKSGDTVVKEGDVSDSIFIIAEGINVVKKIKADGQDTILAYLLPGQTFGEMGVIQETPRTATVVALSETEVLKVEASYFTEVIKRHGEVGLYLAKMLSNYLSDTNKRLLRGGKKSRLILILDMHGVANGQTISRLLAGEMHRQSMTSTIYSEWPDVTELAASVEDYGTKNGPYHLMEGGLTVLSDPHKLPFGEINNIPLTIDRLLNEFSDVVLYLNEMPSAKIQFMGENLTHMIYLHSGKQEELQKADMLFRSYRSLLQGRDIEYYQVSLGVENELETDKNEFFITGDQLLPPEVKGFEAIDFKHPMVQFCKKLVDRFERNNRVGIFIPSKYDSGDAFDSTVIIDQTMSFMGNCFGGATLEEIKGVWNSDKIGIVGEKIYLIYAYTTPKDLQKYLDQVVAYTRRLKSDLRQEAMAMEVNKKLTLI